MLSVIDKIPLDNFAISDYFPRAKVLKYSEIKNYTVSSLFNNFPACFILIEEKKNIGHWVTLIKFKNKFEYFDPMGGKPDNINWLTKSINNKLHQNKPYIQELLKGYPIEYNNIKLQKNNTATCGRFCVWRVYMAVYKNVQHAEFIKMMKELKTITRLNYDKITSSLINNI